ncbi:MAG TPA: DUF2071 domain-containing protein [Chloroflexota bacterium]|nr:DUF2071 domain-containing protein [Chloroflexota bacterium]
MRFPALRGIIRRRILLNFRVDPEVMQRQLPPPFRPQLIHGSALAGICLIRLERLRPSGVPSLTGVSSENAAHRVAVTWTDAATGEEQTGVYISRRDTGSALTALAGGRLFPGEQQRAQFRVSEEQGTVSLMMVSQDREANVQVVARVGGDLPSHSIFASLEEASRFFAAGTTGYSVCKGGTRLDGVALRTSGWRLNTLDVRSIASTYFESNDRFPPGSVVFDSGLIMRNISHEWYPAPALVSALAC